jgi:hypothetical protein
MKMSSRQGREKGLERRTGKGIREKDGKGTRKKDGNRNW